MKIVGIELTNFMSYGGDKPTAWKTPGPVNVLVGQNNAGKSNFFRALRRCRGFGAPVVFEQGDFHDRSSARRPSVTIDVEFLGSELDEIIGILLPRLDLSDPVKQVIVGELGNVFSFEFVQGNPRCIRWGMWRFVRDRVQYSLQKQVGA